MPLLFNELGGSEKPRLKFSSTFFKRWRRSNARSVGRLRRGETPPIVRKRHRREISSLWLEIGNPHKWGGSPFDAKAILIVCRFSFVTAGAKEKLTKENAVGCFARCDERPTSATCYFGHKCPRREFSSKTSPSAKPFEKGLSENDSFGSS